jgi:hypothetical protein
MAVPGFGRFVKGRKCRHLSDGRCGLLSERARVLA